ncbi:MAG: transporter substrate-binding domain-containing protein [Desulfobacterales bacterium]|nr:transporter substrate-binding domain-containing protein [Desulfobacterales bacterium]
MRKVSIFVAVVLILVLFGANSFAADKVVLVTGEWEPYTSEKIENYGFFSEIVTAVFKEIGVEIEYQFLPWKRCELTVKEGKAFATFPYAVSEERKKDFDFTDNVASSTGRFFFMKSKLKKEVVWENFSDLKDYKLGGTLGYWYEKDFKEAGLKVDYASSDTTGMEKLYAGRFELLATEELVGWGLIKKLFPKDIDDFDTLKKPLNVSELHLMVSKIYPNSSEIKEKFNSGLKSIKEKGIYSEILKKYNLKE